MAPCCITTLHAVLGSQGEQFIHPWTALTSTAGEPCFLTLKWPHTFHIYPYLHGDQTPTSLRPEKEVCLSTTHAGRYHKSDETEMDLSNSGGWEVWKRDGYLTKKFVSRESLCRWPLLHTVWILFPSTQIPTMFLFFSPKLWLNYYQNYW